MRNPGGYGVIFAEHGNDVGTDRYGRAVEREHDTFTCYHCNTVVFVRPKEDPANIGGMCYMCMKLVCPKCAEDGKCVPFEEKLLRQAKQNEVRRWYLECT